MLYAKGVYRPLRRLDLLANKGLRIIWGVLDGMQYPSNTYYIHKRCAYDILEIPQHFRNVRALFQEPELEQPCHTNMFEASAFKAVGVPLAIWLYQ